MRVLLCVLSIFLVSACKKGPQQNASQTISINALNTEAINDANGVADLSSSQTAVCPSTADTAAGNDATQAIDRLSNANWKSRHLEILAEISKRKKSGINSEVVFIGDSITEAWSHANEHRGAIGIETWKKFLKYNPLNLGSSGDQTQNVLWRIQHGELNDIKPKVVVLLIGTNNINERIGEAPTSFKYHTRQIYDGIVATVKSIQSKLPASKILLLSILPRTKPSDACIPERIKEVNHFLYTKFANSDSVTIFNLEKTIESFDLATFGTTYLLNDAFNKDYGLHLNEDGYARLASAEANGSNVGIKSIIDSIMNGFAPPPAPSQLISTGLLASPTAYGDLPDKHPFKFSGTRQSGLPTNQLAATLLTDDTMHRSRGSGVVMLSDRWLFFWREANVHTATDPDSVIKMGTLNLDPVTQKGTGKLENIHTIYQESGGITATDIRARLMDDSTIGIFGSRRKAINDDGDGKGDILQPFFMYSKDKGAKWTSMIFDGSNNNPNFNPCSPSFTFNRYSASARTSADPSATDNGAFILYCHGVSSGDKKTSSIYAVFTKDNGRTWEQSTVIGGMAGATKTSEVSVVQLEDPSNPNRWIMFGRNESCETRDNSDLTIPVKDRPCVKYYNNVIYRSTDMIKWDGPVDTGKSLGANSTTAVYNNGAITWITRSSPNHYEKGDLRANKVDGKVFEGLLSTTVDANAVWNLFGSTTTAAERVDLGDKWQILSYLPVHFDGTFTKYKGNWFLLFGAIEGPFTPTGSPSGKTFSRLGIMSSADAYYDQKFLPQPNAATSVLARDVVRSDAFEDFAMETPKLVNNEPRYSNSSPAGAASSSSVDRFYESDVSLVSLSNKALVATNPTAKNQTMVTYFTGQTLPVGYTLRMSLNFSVSQADSSLQIGIFNSRGGRPLVGGPGFISNGNSDAPLISDAKPWATYIGTLLTLNPQTAALSAYHRNSGIDSFLVNNASTKSYTILTPIAVPATPIPASGLFAKKEYRLTIELLNTGKGITQIVKIKKPKDPSYHIERTFFDPKGSTRFDTIAFGIPPTQALTLYNLSVKTISPQPDFQYGPPTQAPAP